MRAEEHDELADMESDYWWHVGRRHLIRSLLEARLPPDPNRRVLDVGCGAGGNLGLLAEFGDVLGAEPAGPGLDGCRARGLGPDRVVEAGAERLPFDDESFGLVTALDVIEHLDDDLGALKEMRRVLRPGGHLLLTVPAYRFLWSVHDEALGHRRRYMASEIHRLLNAVGLTILRRTYAISFPLPGIMGFRIAQGLIPSLYRESASYVHLPGPLNKLLIGALKLEASLIKRVDLPVGTSIIALSRKGDPQ